MKSIYKALVSLFALGSSGFSADVSGLDPVTNRRDNLDLVTLATSKMHPSGATNVPNSELLSLSATNALNLYRLFTDLDFVIDSRAAAVPHQVSFLVHNVPRAQLAKELEKALLQQAGIVITRLDTNLAWVTYNDALPLMRTNKLTNPTNEAHSVDAPRARP